ncbi:hypothetical protein FRC11_007266, partial [Ceratobasidium sp. 423]
MSMPDKTIDPESEDWALSPSIWDGSPSSSPSSTQYAYNQDPMTPNPIDDAMDSGLGVPSDPISPATLNPPSPNPLPNSSLKPNTGSTREQRLTKLMENAINALNDEGESFASWMAFIFDHRRGAETKDLRCTHFWKYREHVTSLLNTKEIQTEASQVTSSKVLQSSKLDIGPEYLENFKIQNIRDELQAHCSVSIQMFLALAGVDASITTLAAAPVSARNVVMYSMVALLREYNQLNNLIQVVFALFMYAAGLHRQAFAVLCHVRLLKKTPTTEESGQATKPKKETPIGPLKALANGCMARLERLAQEGILNYIFDNINLVKKISEQVLGCIDSQMNGTCATAFEVTGATPEALDQQAAMDSLLAARPLNIGDILLTSEEQALHNDLMIHNILRIVVQHGGNHFGCYREILEETQPATKHLIDVHQSRFYSLPAMEVDESKVDGVIDVMDTINSKLKIGTTSAQYQGTVHFVGGDRKSVGNLRAAKHSRAGNDDPAFSFQNLIPLIGLFHMLMAAIIGFLTIHFGNPTSNVDNPSSLSYHN